LRLEPQLGRLLQSGNRPNDRAAIGRRRSRTPQAASLGYRAKACRRRRPPDHLLSEKRYLPAALRQRTDADGQQPVQRLASGGCLARQVTAAVAVLRCNAGGALVEAPLDFRDDVSTRASRLRLQAWG